MTKTLKRPEVLAPAGTLEKLKVAVRYGADAVFIGGQAYGLRSRAGNFTYEQMEEGVQFAAKYGAKVYVAANMVMHEGNEIGAGEFFRKCIRPSSDCYCSIRSTRTRNPFVYSS